MNLPPTVTEQQFLAALSHITSVLAAKHKFASHEPDDVGQMVAVYALEALPRYDPEKGNLEGFLYRHCSNRLLNIHRDLGFRSDSPCKVCFDRARGRGDGHPDGSTCPDFESWWARRQKRVYLAMPVDISKVASIEQESRCWTDSTTETAAADKELLDLLDMHIPLDLRADFLRMRIGEPVPKVRRDRVLRAAREILDDPSRFGDQGPDDTFEECNDVFEDADDESE